MVMVMKTSLVCLLLVIYMGIFYFSGRHLPLKSTRIFFYHYASALILTSFDLITLYTVNHMDRVPESMNLTAHIIYLLAINATIYLYFLYLRSLLEDKIKIPRRLRIIQAAPFAVISILILALPIEYVEGVYTNYSLGPKAYALYVSVIIYNLLILYYCIRYWRLISREKRAAVIASVPIFVGISVIDIIMPEALCVIVYVILTTLGLMMSNENSEKYLDQQTGMFNRYALETVVGEYIARKQKVFLVVMGGLEDVEEHTDWKKCITAMQEIQHFCKKELKRQAYRVGDDGFVLLADSKQAAKEAAAEVIIYIEKQYGRGIEEKYKILALDQYTDSGELMSEVMEICSNTVSRMAVFDFLTGARNRNSLEKKLKYMRNEGVDAYYFLADVNNLKTTNDTSGHSAGDELLQTMVRVLTETAGDDGMVFRYGGDEFVVLWNGTDADRYLEALERNCKRLNSSRTVPLSFAIGYGKVLESDGAEKADRMMYTNKIRMKESC